MMGTTQRYKQLSLGLMFMGLSACGDQSMLIETPELNLYSEGSMLGEDVGMDEGRDVADGGDLTSSVKPYCSALSFSGVTWNKQLTAYERRSLAIALSLSGSFEGSNGWKNLTNNFDGMGLSAGLLNQTLGTSSLQPLLANLKSRNPAAFNVVASSRRESLLAMVTTWQNTQGYKVPAVSGKLTQATEDNVTSSALDIPEFSDGIGFSGKIGLAASASSSSVSWAVSNLYSSTGSFKAEWKTELAALMGHASYVSEQIGASEVLHRRAMGYVNRLGFSSLRAYLLMFDICVQNGGLNESEFVELEGDIKSERLTAETTILKRLIEIRLRRVLSEWRNDVRSRKIAIIDGIGTVHGSSRNFPKQYCFSPLDPIK